MNLKQFFIGFITIFALTLVVTGIVSFLYSLVVHGTGVFDWELAFRLAIIFGLILPITRTLEGREKKKTA
jgi:hypothetical protein